METITFIVIETLLISLTTFIVYINTYNYETKAGKFLYEAENNKEFIRILLKNIVKDFYPLSISTLAGIFLVFLFLPFGISIAMSVVLNNTGRVIFVGITILYTVFKMFKLYLYERPVYRFVYENGKLKEIYKHPVLSRLVSKKYLEKALERFLESVRDKKSILAELEIRTSKFPIWKGLFYAGLSAKVYIFKVKENKKIRNCFDEYYLSGITKS